MLETVCLLDSPISNFYNEMFDFFFFLQGRSNFLVQNTPQNANITKILKRLKKNFVL